MHIHMNHFDATDKKSTTPGGEADRERALRELQRAADRRSTSRSEAQPPTALLVGERDLEQVENVLHRMRVETQRVRSLEGGEPWQEPSKLLVMSGRQALSLGRSKPRGHKKFTTIAIFEETSRTLRARLESMGFDHLVRGAVHPEALELLLRRALYGNEEQRGLPRFPFGWDVTWSTGWRQRRALLAEISARGCRLHVPNGLSRGGKLQVRIPAGVEGSEAITLPGRVIRSRPASPSRYEDSAILSVVFERLGTNTRADLFALLSKLRSGPPAIPPS
jgi:hypothetical protein